MLLKETGLIQFRGNTKMKVRMNKKQQQFLKKKI